MTDPIIHSEDGQTYDLTKNRIAFGLLPRDVQDALSAWPHGIEMFIYGPDTWNRSRDEPPHELHSVSEFVYRARPAPDVKEHVLFWKAGEAATLVEDSTHTHRITIRDDGHGNLTATLEAVNVRYPALF
jgi:hypothetical protein